MNVLVGRLLAFGLGCATAVALAGALKRAAPGAPAGSDPPSSRVQAQRSVPFDLAAALSAATKAMSPAERAAAALELARIPDHQIPEALEQISVQDHQLTPAMKILLARWGEADGAAAMQWAWERLRSKGGWDTAFRQSGSAWAWTDPEGFAAWVSGALGEGKARFYDSLDDQDAETPKLSFDAISRACRWLATEDPLLATRLFIQRGGWSSDDHKFALHFSNAHQVQEALTAFDNLDELTPFKVSGNQMVPHALLQRWQELDPEGFKASPYASILSGTASDEIDEQIRGWAAVPEAERTTAANQLLADSDPDQRNVQLVRLANEWTTRSPEEASAWIDSLPTADRERALRIHTRIRAAADLDDTIAWIGGRPVGDHSFCLALAYDGWYSEATAPPEQSAWPEPFRRAWSDLEALRAGDTEE